MANGHGGKRENSGHPTKAKMIGLVDQMTKLKPTEDILNKIVEIIDTTEDERIGLEAIRLWMAYLVGRPKETIDQHTKAEIEIVDSTSFGLP